MLNCLLIMEERQFEPGFEGKATMTTKGFFSVALLT